jgi:hypothetical protein
VTWVRWPTVGAGFYSDDAVQIAMLRGDFPAKRSSFDLFRFADEARDGRALVHFGYDPWWTEPGLRIALFRPLSSALLALDYRLFGLHATPYHLHSVLWGVALLCAAAAFFARALPARAAPVALVLFALDEGQTAPVAWIANRSSLVSAVFAVLALWVHLEARLSPGWKRRTLEAALFALSLLGGEYGYGFLAYVLALEFFSEDDEATTFRALFPAGAAATLCFFGSAVAGFGARGSGYYLSPLGAPREFFRAVVERVPALYADLVIGTPALEWVNLPAERGALTLKGLGGVALLALAAWWTGRAVAAPMRRRVYGLAFGAVLAALPGAAGLPEDRLLVPASLGAAAVLATFVSEAVRFRPFWLFGPREFAERPRSVLAGVLPLLALVPIAQVHVVNAVERSRGLAQWFAAAAPALRRWADAAEIPETPTPPCAILVTGADFTTNANIPWLRLLSGKPLPRCYWRLSTANAVHQIERPAPNVIEVAILSSQLEGTMTDSLYRSAHDPIRRGDVFVQPGLRVDVQAVERGNPWRMRFTFDRDVDDPSYVFLYPKDGRLERVTLPAVGQKTRFPFPEQPPM